jgi:FLVCR family MFS transporter 7
MATNYAGSVPRDNKATMGPSGDNGDGASIGWMDLKNMGSKIRVRDQKDKRALRNTESGASADLSALSEVTSNDGLLSEEDGAREGSRGTEGGHTANETHGDGATTYKVYKRRWFGLFQLALLNIIVSWDVSNCFCLDSSLMELT